MQRWPWLLLCAACGPSFQAVYEGNARFEHCYALEENPQAPMNDKASCWRDWSEHYTYGQTRDRVHYATARYVALSDPRLPTDEAMMMAAPGETPRATTITAPAPTNAFAPPPKVLDEGVQRVARDVGHPGEASNLADIGFDGGIPSSVIVSLPQSRCADGCGTGHRNCTGRCVADAGPARSCEMCLQVYKDCMRDCFK